MRRRSLLRQVLASTAGKIGVALAIILVSASLLVIVTFPLDFGPSRWSNPAVWADYPKAVPPAWTAVLSDRAVPHQVLETSRASRLHRARRRPAWRSMTSPSTTGPMNRPRSCRSASARSATGSGRRR